MNQSLQKNVVPDGDLKDRMSQTIAELRRLKQECLDLSLAIEEISKSEPSERIHEEELGSASLDASDVVASELSTNEEPVEPVTRLATLREMEREAGVASEGQFVSGTLGASSVRGVTEDEAPVAENLFESFKAGSLRKTKAFRSIEDVQAEQKDSAKRDQAYKDQLKSIEAEGDVVRFQRESDIRSETED